MADTTADPIHVAGPDDPDPTDRRRSLLVALAAAGALAFPSTRPLALTLAALVAFVVAHEAGHFAAARATGMHVSDFFAGFGPVVWSTRRGEVTYGIRALPLGGFVKITGMNASDDVPDELEARTWRAATWPRKVLVAFAGPGTNIALAFAALAVAYAAFGAPTATLTVDRSVAGYPAAEAGIEPGDVLVAVDGVPLEEWADLGPRLTAGNEAAVTVSRAGERLTVPVVPRDDAGRVVLGVRPVIDDGHPAGVAGIGLAARDVAVTAGGVVDALAAMPAAAFDTAASLAGGNDPDLDGRPLSPIGAAELGTEAARNGPAAILSLVAVINLFLALFNLVPVPPLDGGLIAVATVNRAGAALTRNPAWQVDERAVLTVTYVAALAIAALALVAFSADLLAPVELP